jgi:hypothetical protein
MLTPVLALLLVQAIVLVGACSPTVSPRRPGDPGDGAAAPLLDLLLIAVENLAFLWCPIATRPGSPPTSSSSAGRCCCSR